MIVELLLAVVGIALLFFGLSLPRWKPQSRAVWQVGLLFILIAINIAIASAYGLFAGWQWPTITWTREDTRFMIFWLLMLMLFLLMSSHSHTHPPGGAKP